MLRNTKTWLSSALLLVWVVLDFSPAFSQPAVRLDGIDSSSSFLVYYGNDFSADQINRISQFDVVVIDPNSPQLTPAVVADLQARGVQYVLGYLTIGEDDAPDLIPGNGEGPVFHNGQKLVQENLGVASFYVDQEWNGSNYVSDGEPDINKNFGGRFILPNEDWRWVINTQRIGGSVGLPFRSVAGIEQILGDRQSDSDTDRSHDFGFDGIFLDTLDTAGPFENVWGYYSWAAEEMSRTVRFIHESHPEKVLLANRGLFFYDPKLVNTQFGIRPFDFNFRASVNAVLFESYMLDSNPLEEDESIFFPDNLNNVAPKLMAEANRSDGFTVFSLDYQLNREVALLEEAFDRTARDNGWVEYLARDGLLDNVATFAAEQELPIDTEPPVWGSTAAIDPSEIPPRIGIQTVTAGPGEGEVTLHWDIAKDQTVPIKYNVYQSTEPDFLSPTVYRAVSYETGEGWDQGASPSYANRTTIGGLSAGTYFFRVRAEDSSPNANEDQNEVALQVVVPSELVSNPGSNISVDGDLSDWASLNAQPSDPDDAQTSSDLLDWLSLKMAHSGRHLFLAYENDGPIELNWAYNIYIDTDRDGTTGFRGSALEFPVGAEFLLQGAHLFVYTGSGTDWSWSFVNTAEHAISGPRAELSLERSWLGHPERIEYFAFGFNPAYPAGSLIDLYPDQALTPGATLRRLGYSLSRISNEVEGLTIDGDFSDWNGLQAFGDDRDDVSGTGNLLDWSQVSLAHDGLSLGILYHTKQSLTLNWSLNLYLDTDSNSQTGFRGGSNDFPVGAEYLFQGAHLFRYTGNGNSWEWTFVGTAQFATAGPRGEFAFPLSWLGNPESLDFFLLGDNHAFPGGTSVDQYPNRALQSGGMGRFFQYAIQ